MKKTDRISYREKTGEELIKILGDKRKTLVETKVKHVAGNQKDTSVFEKIKYEISYISTLLTEKKHDK